VVEKVTLGQVFLRALPLARGSNVPLRRHFYVTANNGVIEKNKHTSQMHGEFDIKIELVIRKIISFKYIFHLTITVRRFQVDSFRKLTKYTEHVTAKNLEQTA
jgi:hypothetical protein